LGWAVGVLRSALDLPISADTGRLGPARAALGAGARIINDVTGLTAAPEVAHAVASADAGLVLMASERGDAPPGEPVEVAAALLEESLGIARAAGVPREAIAIDPGIGFFRDRDMPWHAWDCAVLAGLDRLRALGHPICVGVSRKSFIGALADERDAGGRLPGSLAATAVAVMSGAHLIRTHDVAETVQAIRVAEAVRLAAEARSVR
jgi:dihydropteroate synthase